MLRYIRLAAITLIATLLATAASAVGPCGPRSDIIALLKDNFGEVEVGQGLSIRGNLVEIFVSPAGSWTVILSRPDGLSCLADSGEAWLPSTSRETTQFLRLAPPGEVH